MVPFQQMTPMPMTTPSGVPISMPAGMPAPATAPSMPMSATLSQLPIGTAQVSSALPPITAPLGQQAPQTVENIMYTPAYLRTQIGRYVKIEFLIGTNMLVDREGTLVAVGASYVILQEAETDDLLLCDIYSIKFVKIYY